MSLLLATYLTNFIGTPYVWNGKDLCKDKGFDCSGLVCEGLRAVGLLGKQNLNSQMLYDRYLHDFIYEGPIKANDLLFFGKGGARISHVAVAISPTHMIEAGGGSQKVKEGMVRIRPIKWRKDFIIAARVQYD